VLCEFMCIWNDVLHANGIMSGMPMASWGGYD